MKLKKINNWQLLFIILLAFLMLAAAKEYERATNLRVKGWLFGDSTWCGKGFQRR